jgi:hypothetical protein
MLDTAEPDGANESPISGSEVPGGWYVVFLNDIEHPYPTSTVFGYGTSLMKLRGASTTWKLTANLPIQFTKLNAERA